MKLGFLIFLIFIMIKFFLSTHYQIFEKKSKTLKLLWKECNSKNLIYFSKNLPPVALKMGKKFKCFMLSSWTYKTFPVRNWRLYVIKDLLWKKLKMILELSLKDISLLFHWNFLHSNLINEIFFRKNVTHCLKIINSFYQFI